MEMLQKDSCLSSLCLKATVQRSKRSRHQKPGNSDDYTTKAMSLIMKLAMLVTTINCGDVSGVSK